jgi:hypothetical protein
MCSVIEIKNANEYYIRYHGPESMLQQQQEGKLSNDLKSDSSGISGDSSTTAAQSNNLLGKSYYFYSNQL